MIWPPSVKRGWVMCKREKRERCYEEACNDWVWVITGHIGGCGESVIAARDMPIGKEDEEHNICCHCYTVGCYEGTGPRCDCYDGTYLEVPEWVLRAMNLEPYEIWFGSES